MSQSSSQRILQQYQQQDVRGRYRTLTSFYESGKVGAVKYLMWAAQNDPDAELRTYAGQCAQELRVQLGLREVEPAPKLGRVEAPVITDEALQRKQKQVTQLVSSTQGGTVFDTLLAVMLIVVTVTCAFAVFLPWITFADVQLNNGVVMGPMIDRHEEIVQAAVQKAITDDFLLLLDTELLTSISEFHSDLPMLETFVLLERHDSPYYHLYSEHFEVYQMLEQEIGVRLSLRALSEDLQSYVPLGVAIGVALMLGVLLGSLVIGLLLNEWVFEQRFDMTVSLTGSSFYWLVWLIVSLLLLIFPLVFTFVTAPHLMEQALRSMGFVAVPYAVTTIVGEGVWLMIGSAAVAVPVSLLGLVRSLR